MTPRENVHAIADRLIDISINLADSPHGGDLDEYNFRDYFFKFRHVADYWLEMIRAFWLIYRERRKELRQ